MGLDRFVNFKDEVPTLEQLQLILEDYLNGAGEVDYQKACWYIVLAGKPSFPFRRVDKLFASRQEIYDQHRQRWFEVFVGSLDREKEVHKDAYTGEEYTLGPSIDVITRMGDDYTNDVARGFAKLIARYFKAELDEG